MMDAAADELARIIEIDDRGTQHLLRYSSQLSTARWTGKMMAASTPLSISA